MWHRVGGAAAAVPALPNWGFVFFLALMLMAGLYVLRQRG